MARTDQRYVGDQRELVRLVMAGSVDDGKSTLIGRLLYDCHVIYEDQVFALEQSSAKRGTSGIDFSLLTDGLVAEREQGITIDVAYRYFSTPQRRFIIADVPGHEQYTKNMVTGASLANIAVILVDAVHGMSVQSKRHIILASLLRIPHILVVINKMDAVRYDEKIYEKIKNVVRDFTAKLDIFDIQCIPLSALHGDMVVERNCRMPWYAGRTLYDYIENVQIASDRNLIDFRLSVQTVVRGPSGMRGYAGSIAGGSISKGDEIAVLPSGKTTRIASLVVGMEERDQAWNPQAVLVTLADEVDVSRGDVLVKIHNRPLLTQAFEALIFWMDDEPLDDTRVYFIKHGTNVVRGSCVKILYRLNIDSLHREMESRLRLNEIGRVRLETHSPLMIDPYAKNKGTGSFIVIDEMTNNTVGGGIIIDKLPTEQFSQESRTKKSVPVIWFTGLSGSGKSTLAQKLSDELQARRVDTEILDGDALRALYDNDLGFSSQDRDKNIERAVGIAGMLSRHGVLVLASFITPYERQRAMIRSRFKDIIEIFVDAPLEICESRDTKGLYKKARQGEIPFFTGISDAYEIPYTTDIHLKTAEMSVDECIVRIISFLKEHTLIL